MIFAASGTSQSNKVEQVEFTRAAIGLGKHMGPGRVLAKRIRFESWSACSSHRNELHLLLNSLKIGDVIFNNCNDSIVVGFVVL